MPTREEHAAAVRRYKELTDLLYTDAMTWLEKSMNRKDQRDRRIHVHLVFAFFEGVLFSTAEYLLASRDVYGLKFAPAEEMALTEMSYVVQDGKVATRPQYAQLKDRTRLILHAVGRISPTPLKIDYSGVGWAAFQDSIKMRNRITHPKDAAACAISDAEMSTLWTGEGWFLDAHTEFYRVTQEVEKHFDDGSPPG